MFNPSEDSDAPTHGGPGENGAAAAGAATGDLAPDRAIRVVTAIWLLIVTLGMGALIVMLGIGLFIGALLSAANSIPSLAVPIAIAAAFVSSLWLLFARKKHATALLVSLLVPALFSVAIFIRTQRDQAERTPEAIAARTAAEEQALAERAQSAPDSFDSWVDLARFYSDEGRSQESANAWSQAARVAMESADLRDVRFEGCKNPDSYQVCYPLYRLGDIVLAGRVTLEPQPDFPTGLLPEMMSEEFRREMGQLGNAAFYSGLAAAALGYNDVAISTWQYALQLPVVVTGTADPLIIVGGPSRLSFEHGVDAVILSERVARQVALESSEIVFVGHGISEPEVNWDDFKDLDVRGKTLLALDHMPEPRTDAKQGPHYSERDTKYEEGARRGAAGVFVIREEDVDGLDGQGLDWREFTDGFRWYVEKHLLENVDVFQENGDDNANELAVEGWISHAAAAQLLAAAGQDLTALEIAAREREFQPLALGLKASTNINYTVQRGPATTREIITKGMLNALDWYRQAADHGNVRAQGNLGLLYLGGAGVPLDYEQAYYWLLLATTGDAAGINQPDMDGDASLIKRRNDAQDHLSRTRQEAIGRAAREWVPSL